MNNTILKTVSKLSLAVFAVVVFISCAAFAQDFDKTENANKGIIGVWELRIDFRNCDTGEILRTRPGLISFLSDGVMHEFGTGSAPLERSEAQGIWRRETRGNFTSTAKFFRFAVDGSLAGSAKLYREIELGEDGNSLEINVRSEIYDAGGMFVARGCATETGTRFE
jgi:hypothetical protein